MLSLLKPIDTFLDRITMYRLVLYVLTALIIAAVGEAALGILSYSPWAILLSAVLAVATCYVVNEAGARLTKAATSVESVYVTAFILVLILPPAMPGSLSSAVQIVVASLVAMASKYVIAPYKKHIFNPAALGAFLVGAFSLGYASWWVGGNWELLPFVLVGGLAIVHKIRRFDLVLTFIVVATLAIVLTTNSSPLAVVQLTLIHTSLFFFAFVMLTEPLTTPPTRKMRIVYGAIVGVLFAPFWQVGPLFSSPELALLLGNIFAYVVSPKGRYLFTLLKTEESSASTGDFLFRPDRSVHFRAGQFLEWTIPHDHPDSRGTRRFFTIASSPTEEEIRLGVRFFDRKSTFKQALDRLVPGDTISATQLAGEFILPDNTAEKLVFIAGGIGVTPFRSHIKYLLDTKDKREVTLLYANRSPKDIAYLPLLEEAKAQLGTKVVHVVTEGATEGMRQGVVDKEVIVSEVPDYRDRTFYISGPQGMVKAMKATLLTLGVQRARIHTDYFIGLA